MYVENELNVFLVSWVDYVYIEIGENGEENLNFIINYGCEFNILNNYDSRIVLDGLVVYMN